MGKSKVWAIIIVIIAAAVVFLSGGLLEDADRSKNYVCQVPGSGKYKVWTDGGLHMQWFGNLFSYSKTSQITFEDFEKVNGEVNPTGKNPAGRITFNDKGKGVLIGSFRVKLPNNTKHMEKIQEEYGSEEALLESLVKKELYKVIAACGPLMTSLESVSETRTDLNAYITDQLVNGIYKTKLIQIEEKNPVTGEIEIRNKAILVEDANAPGGYARQEISEFSKYGIEPGQVAVTHIEYDDDTQKQIDAQRNANLAMITLKTQALEYQQQAIKAEEQGKAAAAEAKWAQEKEKAVAVTRAQQEFEVAELEAKKAKQVALKVQAEGEAKAAANRALVAAGLTPAERAEWDYKTAVGIAEALANSKVQWVPQVMMGGSSNGSGNAAMDAVGLNMLMDVVKKMNE